MVVPPAMIDQMANLMRRRLEGSRKYVESRSKYYQGRAKQWGINPSAFPGLDVAAPPAAAPAAGSRTYPLLGGHR